MHAPGQDKVYAAAALVAVLASASVFGFKIWSDGQAPSGPPPRVQLADAPYNPTAADVAVVKAEMWASPSSQSKGRDWVYDAFTPPEIFYNARSKHFTVKPPLASSDEPQEEAFGVELVSVRPEPFRLQLIGFFGEGGEARGTFENILSGEVFLGAAGRRVPNLGLTIKSLAIQTVDVTIPQSMTTRQRVATAVVRDDKTGREVVLSHRERRFTGGLSAFVAQSGQSTTREVRAGESFTIGDATYRVNKILLTPPSVEIVKEAPSLAQPDQRTLTPRESDEPAPAEPTAPTL
ncbi:MAG: hypothetical protein HZA93_10245 [Verrucomicrobia bacterium]|nr:hypothetical protein [Verrucomicrobiota bacterium]